MSEEDIKEMRLLKTTQSTKTNTKYNKIEINTARMVLLHNHDIQGNSCIKMPSLHKSQNINKYEENMFPLLWDQYMGGTVMMSFWIPQLLRYFTLLTKTIAMQNEVELTYHL